MVLADFAHVNGGAAQVAITEAEGLARRGWRVTYLYAVGPVGRNLTERGIELRQVDVPDVWNEPSPLTAAQRAIWNGLAYAALRDVLRDAGDEPVIVHAHQWTKALSPSVLAAARQGGAPLVLTLHDYFAACPNGSFFHFGKAQRCTRAPLGPACLASACDRHGRLHKAVRVARQLVTDRLLQSESTTFVHVSAFARDRVGPSLGGHGRHVVIPNPCTVEQAPPVDVAANRALVVIGRLTVEKGMQTLASAWRGTGIPLLVLGDGPARDVLAGLDGPIRLLPWGGHNAVLEVLAQARGLVMPSLWDETSGLVAVEALARGVPAIVSRNTGAAELVERTGGGVVVAGGAVAELREAMLRLADGRQAAPLGASAYAGYWRDPSTPERHLDALERLYRELLTPRAEPAAGTPGSTASGRAA